MNLNLINTDINKSPYKDLFTFFRENFEDIEIETSAEGIMTFLFTTREFILTEIFGGGTTMGDNTKRVGIQWGRNITPALFNDFRFWLKTIAPIKKENVVADFDITLFNDDSNGSVTTITVDGLWLNSTVSLGTVSGGWTLSNLI